MINCKMNTFLFRYIRFDAIIIICHTLTNTLHYLLQWPFHDHWNVQLNKTTTTTMTTTTASTTTHEDKKEMPPPSLMLKSQPNYKSNNNELIERKKIPHKRKKILSWNIEIVLKNCKCYRSYKLISSFNICIGVCNEELAAKINIKSTKKWHNVSIKSYLNYAHFVKW